MKTLGWLIECEGRSLFMREKGDVLWALEDPNYKVTPLVAGEVYETFIVALPVQQADDTAERLQILEEIYELEEEQIAQLKQRLEEAVELVENIHLFSMNQTTNIMEARGLLRLIAESCNKWLKPSE